MEITLTNSFHNTSAKVRPVPIKSGRFSGYHKIARKTVMRLRRELCGRTGCRCGGQFGECNGAYLCVINEDEFRALIINLGASHV
jgi:hypothetical protein